MRKIFDIHMHFPRDWEKPDSDPKPLVENLYRQAKEAGVTKANFLCGGRFGISHELSIKHAHRHSDMFIPTANTAKGAGRMEVGVRPEFVALSDAGLPVQVIKVADVGRHRVVETRAGNVRINELAPEGETVSLGAAHLAFEQTQTRIYQDGWLAGSRG